jgi:hypothetical protein
MAPVRRDSTHGGSRGGALRERRAVGRGWRSWSSRRRGGRGASWTVRMSWPRSRRWVATECRKVWQVTRLSMLETRAASARRAGSRSRAGGAGPLCRLGRASAGMQGRPVPPRLPGRRRNLSGDSVRQPGLAPSGGQCPKLGGARSLYQRCTRSGLGRLREGFAMVTNVRERESPHVLRSRSRGLPCITSYRSFMSLP